MQNNKLVINAYLMRKEPDFHTKPCIVEKAIAVSSREFEYLKAHPLRDIDLIAENIGLMRYDPKEDTYHCLLIYDKEHGDGLLIESEGYPYARYAQYIPNAKLLYETHVQTHLQEIKFYCPLVITADSGDDYEELEALGDADKISCEEAILRKIRSDKDIFEYKRGLMQYCDNDDSMEQAVFSAFPSVEKVNGTLMGVFVCQVSPDITDEQIDKLKDYLSGQASDGWGEGFEQHEIDTPEYGDIYVSFWSGGEEWSLLTKEELNNGTDFQSENMDLTM